MYEGLPEKCYARNSLTNDVILLKREISGYCPTGLGKGTPERIKALNDELGVTTAQRLAMEVGSMFGWDVPGANPGLYEEKGADQNG